MNIERITAIRNRILERPAEYSQNDFIAFLTPDNEVLGEYARKRRGIPPDVCGTAGCIAGEAVIMFHPDAKRIIATQLGTAKLEDIVNGYFLHYGQELLDLDRGQASRLLSSISMEDYTDDGEFENDYADDNGWPYEFAKRYTEATTAEERARVAADRINHFIATNGDE